MDRDEVSAICSEEVLPFIDNIVEMVNAPYFVANGMVPVAISRDNVIVEFRCGPEHRNSNGFIHGGAIYGAMDHTHAILANIVGHAVGQSANVNYFRPARTDILRVVSKTVNESRSLHYTNVEVFEGEKLVAAGTFTAFKLQEIHR